MNQTSSTENIISSGKHKFGVLKHHYIYSREQDNISNITLQYSLDEGETLVVLKYTKVNTSTPSINTETPRAASTISHSSKVIDFPVKGDITPTAGMNLLEEKNQSEFESTILDISEVEECFQIAIQDKEERVLKMKNGIKFLLPIMIASFLFAAISTAALMLMLAGKFQKMDPNILILFIIAGLGWGVTSFFGILKDIRRLK